MQGVSSRWVRRHAPQNFFWAILIPWGGFWGIWSKNSICRICGNHEQCLQCLFQCNQANLNIRFTSFFPKKLECAGDHYLLFPLQMVETLHTGVFRDMCQEKMVWPRVVLVIPNFSECLICPDYFYQLNWSNLSIIGLKLRQGWLGLGICLELGLGLLSEISNFKKQSEGGPFFLVNHL